MAELKYKIMSSKTKKEIDTSEVPFSIKEHGTYKAFSAIGYEPERERK